jgi:hypothetical protein
MNALHIVLKYQWFDLIASGEKTVEYRKITPYWRARIWDKRHALIGEFVTFSRGYTSETIARRIDRIDVGPCPYGGWAGDYYRVHFSK